MTVRKYLSFFAALLCLQVQPLSAQDKPHASIECDFVSHYMWRGQDKGNVSIQPKLGLQWKGLRLGIEGSGGFSNDDYEELDIILNYTWKGLTVGLLDEWGEDWVESRYFEYGSETTHQFSLHLGYDLGFASIDAYTIFAGADHKMDNSRAYSTYIEFGVPFRFGTLDWKAAFGLTPYRSGGVKTQPRDMDEFFEYSYADCFAINMVSLRATKVFDIVNFTLPAFVEFHGNPWNKHANIVLGISLFIL